jgi:hypothetical protein
MTKSDATNKAARTVTETDLRRMARDVAALGSGQRQPATVEYRKEGPMYSVKVIRPTADVNKQRRD